MGKKQTKEPRTVVEGMCETLKIPVADTGAYVNPLCLAIDYEFKQMKPSDYRKRAITRCLRSGINFQSETNTVYNLMVQLIRMVCPVCGRQMRHTGSGHGTGQQMGTAWGCARDKLVINLTLTSDGLRIVRGKWQ